MEKLNKSNQKVIDNYIKKVKNNEVQNYLLTTSRDGEYPVRSIISFDTLEEAIKGYDMYQDAGFAKNYLTVSLYHPSGRVDVKTLKRNHAGDPSFVRQNYIDVTNALYQVKDKLSKEDYENLCIKIITTFAKDNWRFDPNRSLKKLGIDKEL